MPLDIRVNTDGCVRGRLNAASWKDLVLKSRAELTAGESSVLIPLLLDARASFFVANPRPRIHEELNGRQ